MTGRDAHHEPPGPHDAERLLGERVGNFRIDSILGRGGMGTVYLATHHTLARKVAIKVLSASHAADRTLVDRFLDEARAVSGIGHPGLVQIFDFGQLPSGPFYSVMEHLEGRDLERALLQDGPMPPSRVAWIGAQVAAAAAVAHDRGIIHRDLKPANMFLAQSADETTRVVLLDFGIAKLQGDERPQGSPTEVGMIVGTPEYIAPEQARGSAPVDARVDIYALGCVLYQLLAGHPPFRGDSPTGLLISHVQDAPQPLAELREDLPEALVSVVMRCLEKDPDHRYAGMRELRDALAPFADELPPGTLGRASAPDLSASDSAATGPTLAAGEPVATAPTAHRTPTLETRAPPRGRRRLWIAAALAGTGAVALIAAATLQREGGGFGRTPDAHAPEAMGPIGENPYSQGDPLAVAEGAAIWRSQCSGCHGDRGEGDGESTPPGLEPMVFSDVAMEPGTLDRYRFEIVRRGVSEGGDYTMPSFADELTADETWKVVTFITTLAAEPPEPGMGDPAEPPPSLDDPARIDRGHRIFHKRCASCHGARGTGDGQAARFLDRRPADLTAGVYKLRSTPSGSLPRDADLFRTLTTGMGVVGMPSFAGLSEDERWALVAYIKSLSERFDEEEPGEPIEIPPRPPMTESSIERGRSYFRAAGCQTCHGREGRGDGPEADTLENDRGNPIRPPDFAKAQLFIGGSSPGSIYRTMMTGIDGTPMWAGRDFFSAEEAWDVVHFIRSVAGESESRGSPAPADAGSR